MSYSFAQTSEHLTFKGIPINGTLEEFVSKSTAFVILSYFDEINGNIIREKAKDDL